jgi:hypothetical protein
MHTFSAKPRALAQAPFRPQPSTRAKEAVIGNGAPQRWYHVCSVADETRNGYPVSRRMLELFVASFYQKPEQGPVYLGHVDVERMPGAEEPPARAWVLALELTANGELWALYELGPALYEAIRKGEYRFNSICGGFDVDDEGNVLAADFWSIAVTNSPAVPGLLPMAASARRPPAKVRMSIHEILKDAIKQLPDDASPDQVMQFLQGSVAQQAAIEGKPEGEPPAEMAAPPVEEVPAPMADAPKDDFPKLVEPGKKEDPKDPKAFDDAAPAADASMLSSALEAAGIDPAALIAALQERPDEIRNMLGAAPSGTPAEAAAFGTLPDKPEADIKAELSAKTEALEMKVEALSKQLADAQTALESEKATTTKLAASVEEQEVALATKRVEAAIERGLVLETRREKLLAYAKSDRARLDVLLSDAEETPAVPTGKIVTGSPARGAGFDKPETDPLVAHLERQFSWEPDLSRRKALVDASLARLEQTNGRA